jgi:anaerobic selenocysteine-containing dehydrogenase
VREYGTNNMPDCSNMCHESTSVALAEAIGIGKGTVMLNDFYDTDVIIIMGQNPGTNHPRMLTALEKAKKKGSKIIAINPLHEAGLMALKIHKRKRDNGFSTQLADVYLQVQINGDMA